MTAHLSTIDRRAALATISTSLNSGSIQWRTGLQEATPESAATGTLLVTFTFNATFASGSTGADGATQTITANATNSPQNAVAGGLAAHYRLLTSGGRCVQVGDIGTAAPADLVLTNTTIINGSSQTMGVFQLVFPY